MRKLALSALALAALAAACVDQTAPTAVQIDPSFASSGLSPQVADQYIVVFCDIVNDVPGVARTLATQVGGSVGFTYTTALKGFSVHMSAQAADILRRSPLIQLVEADGVATVSTTVQSPEPSTRQGNPCLISRI